MEELEMPSLTFAEEVTVSVMEDMQELVKNSV